MSILTQALTQDKTNLIPFIVAGYPDVGTTIELINLLTEEGVAAIELGVPFSDPVADGPIIQQAAEKSLANGTNLHDILAIARTVRQKGNNVPLILFSYYNPLLAFGLERIAIEAAKAGFNGFIVPDLPYEESEPLHSTLKKVDIPLVPLVAPTSEERIAKIVQHAEGFVYCVSSLGTTGVRQAFAGNIDAFLEQVRTYSPVPIAVGFGISTSEQVRRFDQMSDGVIVGSALVKKMAEFESAFSSQEKKEIAFHAIREFVKELLSE